MRLERVPQGTAGAVAVHPDAGGGGLAGGYTPRQLATAYGVNPDPVTTQTVAVVLWFNNPQLRANLNTFDAHYGLPAETATSLNIVNQSGSTSPLPKNDQGAGLELSLDVQSVRGMCHTCRIVVVEASTPNDGDITVAENTAARLASVVSNSFGRSETSGKPAATWVQAFDHPGKAILVSTGDHGWFDWDTANTFLTSSSNSPSMPSSFNTVVAVGGTSLYLNDDSTRSTESVWNDNGNYDYYGSQMGASLGASGGGCSTRYLAQPFQSSVTGWASTGCTSGHRLAADVAAVADPQTGYDVYDTFGYPGWVTIGGTSLSSPLVAGMWAAAGGPTGTPYPAAGLYRHYIAHDGALYDVTTGGNGACANSSATACLSWFNYYYGFGPNQIGEGLLDCAFKGETNTTQPITGQCDAKVGYDGPSGVGTPANSTLFR